MASILDYLKSVDKKPIKNVVKKPVVIKRTQPSKQTQPQQEQIKVVKKQENRVDHASSILDGLDQFDKNKIKQQSNKTINHADKLL
jgi:hypothetical protein